MVDDLMGVSTVVLIGGKDTLAIRLAGTTNNVTVMRKLQVGLPEGCCWSRGERR